MSVVKRNLGSVIGPQGPIGPAGTYVLTSNDKEDIADIVGNDKYLPRTALRIDVYNATSSIYPSVVDYVVGTVTVTDSDDTTIATFQTNAQQVVMYCPPYSKYTVSVTANGFTTPQDQTVVVQPNGSTISFSMTPTAEVYYDVLYKVEGEIVQASRVLPHASVPYTGNDLSVEGKVWTGWDAVAADVISNMVINAVLVTPTQPAESKVVTDYDYAWTDDETKTSAYTLAELCWILMSASDIQTYIPIGSMICFTKDLNTTYFDEGIRFVLVSTKHYELSDSTGWARSSWVAQDALKAQQRMMSANDNIGGWSGSEMRTWLNDTVFPILPEILRSLIKQVKVGSTTGDMRGSAEWSNNKLYLSSYCEVGLSVAQPFIDEVADGANETTFSVFTNNTSRIRYRFGRVAADSWHLRSPNINNNKQFNCVAASGASTVTDPMVPRSVVVCFSI